MWLVFFAWVARVPDIRCSLGVNSAIFQRPPPPNNPPTHHTVRFLGYGVVILHNATLILSIRLLEGQPHVEPFRSVIKWLRWTQWQTSFWDKYLTHKLRWSKNTQHVYMCNFCPCDFALQNDGEKLPLIIRICLISWNQCLCDRNKMNGVYPLSAELD